MARYTGPVCKLCRRENTKLFLKGDKCMSEKCPMNNPKVKIPGPHGDRRRKLTEYGTQLRERQKTKRYYGVMERQFANYFDMATKVKGMTTGEALLQILERRLDNVVYRLGFAMSRAEAKQLVNHGHFTVNGKKVNILCCYPRISQQIANNRHQGNAVRQLIVYHKRTERLLFIRIIYSGTAGSGGSIDTEYQHSSSCGIYSIILELSPVFTIFTPHLFVRYAASSGIFSLHSMHIIPSRSR